MSLSAKRQFSLDRVDSMNTSHRELVHEFGLSIVNAFIKHGITSPVVIREIMREVWGGARQAGQRVGTLGSLDSLLINSGSSLTASGLQWFLADNHHFIVSSEPSRAMIEASMSEVSGFSTRCTKEEKHRRRLRAAIRASSTERGVV